MSSLDSGLLELRVLKHQVVLGNRIHIFQRDGLAWVFIFWLLSPNDVAGVYRIQHCVWEFLRAPQSGMELLQTCTGFCLPELFCGSDWKEETGSSILELECWR